MGSVEHCICSLQLVAHSQRFKRKVLRLFKSRGQNDSGAPDLYSGCTRFESWLAYPLSLFVCDFPQSVKWNVEIAFSDMSRLHLSRFFNYSPPL